MSQEQIAVKDIKEQTGYLVYSKEVVHKHSPAVQRFLDFVLHHIDTANERAKAEGKEVIIVGMSNYCPIVYASGAIPLDVSDMARIGNMESIAKAEEYYQIPAETCAMIKAMLGGVSKFKTSVCHRIVIPSLRCEPELTAFSMLENYGYETFILDFVKKPTSGSPQRMENAYRKYGEELNKLAFWIGRKEIDKEKLHAEIVRANRIHDKIDRVVALQKLHPTYMKTLPTMLLMSGKESYYGQPEEYERILDAIIGEMEELAEDSYNDRLVKLIWSGARGVDFSVYNAVDILGGQIAGWHLPISGNARFDETLDPMEACVDYGMHGKNVLSQNDICNQVLKLYEDNDAKGVIVYLTLGCTFNTINYEIQRRQINDKNIPTLSLTGTAQIGEATGQVMTRLKAFIEMLS